ncbi:MAG: hypothetical protein OEY49_03525 [Candidatus Heimdallarchaeota archaeon]|nr:hypothetical protein [Candidatus Heimdallarchaeota archaeon]
MATCEKCNQNEGTEYKFMIAGSSFQEESGHTNFYDVREGSGVICITCTEGDKKSQLMVRLIFSVVALLVGIYFVISASYIAGGIAIVLGIFLFISYNGIKNEDADKSGQRAIINAKRSSFEGGATLWSMDDYESELSNTTSTLFDKDKQKITSK